MTKIAACLWYDGDAEAAAHFYTQIFPDSRISAVNRAAADYPSGKAGDILTVEFTVCGREFVGLNGGPHFRFDEAVSFQVFTDDQAETDRYWSAIVDGGGSASACGWCKDRWGLCWQIVPRQLLAAMSHADPAAARCAMEAMMTMSKIDIAAIEAAVAGGA
jgi:2-polyprenyl-6-hydroxyphenyl methylase/3-demethylubiquinone-9 3-methyltransferase